MNPDILIRDTIIPETIMDLTLDDHNAAFTEVAFLIDIFTSTIDNIMGGATASVGRMAGRDTAKKYPVFLENPSLNDVVTVVSKRMKAGFGITLETSGDDRSMVFDRCIIRDICEKRGIDMGQAMCRLFHFYMDGVINELVNRPVKSEISHCGKPCRTLIRIQ